MSLARLMRLIKNLVRYSGRFSQTSFEGQETGSLVQGSYSFSQTTTVRLKSIGTSLATPPPHSISHTVNPLYHLLVSINPSRPSYPCPLRHIKLSPSSTFSNHKSPSNSPLPPLTLNPVLLFWHGVTQQPPSHATTTQ